MDAKDLRIGNKILRNGVYETIFSVEWHEVTEQYFAVLDNGCCYEDLENVFPIPLTEEILLKCGAVKEKACIEAKESVIYWSIGSFGFFQDTDSKTCGVNLIDEDSATMWSYLHQLQNLYFSLTNKELEINL